MKKNLIKSLVAAFAATTLFTACNNAPADKPAVNIKEANIEGTYICVEADIEAAAKTRSISVKVYSATNNMLLLEKEFNEAKYAGKLNIPDFHEHIDLNGATVTEGDMLWLAVTDQNNQTTTEKQALTEEEDEDE